MTSPSILTFAQPSKLPNDPLPIFGGPHSGRVRNRHAGRYTIVEIKMIDGRRMARPVAYEYDPRCVAFTVAHAGAWVRDDDRVIR